MDFGARHQFYIIGSMDNGKMGKILSVPAGGVRGWAVNFASMGRFSGGSILLALLLTGQWASGQALEAAVVVHCRQQRRPVAECLFRAEVAEGGRGLRLCGGAVWVREAVDVFRGRVAAIHFDGRGFG